MKNLFAVVGAVLLLSGCNHTQPQTPPLEVVNTARAARTESLDRAQKERALEVKENKQQLQADLKKAQDAEDAKLVQAKGLSGAALKTFILQADLAHDQAVAAAKVRFAHRSSGIRLHYLHEVEVGQVAYDWVLEQASWKSP
jgi:hypothetical protein